MTPTTPIARSSKAWWYRSRPRCSTRSVASSSSKTRSWSPPQALTFTARAVAAGTAAAPCYGEPGAANRVLGEARKGSKYSTRIGAGRCNSRRTTPLHAVITVKGQCDEAAPRADATPAPAAFLRELNAQREQRDCADAYDQDHQRHRIVVEPMPALYTHDAPRPERPTHSSPGSHIEGRRGFTSLLVADGGSEVQTCGSSELAPPETWRRPARDPWAHAADNIVP